MELPDEIRRWATFGPWYAMFPVDFALSVVHRYSSPGALVVDPFCGRGTTPYIAEALGRRGFGVEVNAVGWTYAATKLRPASLNRVLDRLTSVALRASRSDLPDLPLFFTRAYAPNVRKFLAAARDMLDWRSGNVDRTAMAMLLLYAHGSRKNSFSNQMRQTKSMSPAYAIDWWETRDMKPPKLDPIEFLKSRLEWRYQFGYPSLAPHGVVLGDSTRILPRRASDLGKWSLLLTSPPYMKVANYHYDQWIRMWLLGGPPYPVVNGGKHQTWFGNREEYRDMLLTVFGNLAKTAKRGAVIYVRTDARQLTKQITLDVLREAFPSKHIRVNKRPMIGNSQTDLYNEGVVSPGEVDIILK